MLSKSRSSIITITNAIRLLPVWTAARPSEARRNGRAILNVSRKQRNIRRDSTRERNLYVDCYGSAATSYPEWLTESQSICKRQNGPGAKNTNNKASDDAASTNTPLNKNCESFNIMMPSGAVRFPGCLGRTVQQYCPDSHRYDLWAQSRSSVDLSVLGILDNVRCSVT